MDFTPWFLVIGLLLVAMALAGSLLKRLPLSASMLYMAAGIALGPHALGLLRLDPLDHTEALEAFTEVALLVSLFSAGLKLRLPLRDRRWAVPIRLASISMVLTIGLVALVGHYALGLPLGAAVLLGAMLAPTDPVLASEVQVTGPTDTDRLRFAPTGEAGLNDGAALPFALLGLGLLGLHDLGWKWVAIDMAWGGAAGLGLGGLLGMLIARLVLYLRREHREAVGLDDYLALGLMALSHGLASLVHAHGFLAVFAAGLALRRVERQATGEESAEVEDVAGSDEEAATHPEKAAAYMAESVLGFNEKLERIMEVAVMLLLGGMLPLRSLPTEVLWFIPLMFLLIRPVSVAVGLIGAGVLGPQRRLASWFGIRGVGAVYYLMFAAQHGLPEPLNRRLSDLVLTVVAASVVAHGVSVTPLMERYRRRDAMAAGEPAG
jgi:sodium/hydrogen antiporter